MSKTRKPKKDVLVADGVGFYRRMMVELLSAQGYRVTEADTIESAIEQIQAERPDLILFDAELPGGGGKLKAMSFSSREKGSCRPIACCRSILKNSTAKFGTRNRLVAHLKYATCRA